MKVLLDIPDNKISSFMEVINSISYVKAKPLTDTKAKLLEEIREAVEEKKLIPKCPLEIYYEKILLQNYFCTQFFVLNVAKATSAGKNFSAL